MKQDFEFEQLGDTEKKILLSAFNYEVDKEGNIIDSLFKEKLVCEETKEPLTIHNAALLPGSLKVVSSDPLTISKYLREEIESK